MTGRVAALLVIAAACGGATEKPAPTAHTDPGPGGTATRPAAPVDPGPPPPRDCTLLAPAIERIIAAEIADIRATRPKEVAPVAEQEAEATRAILVDVLPVRCDADHWSGAYTACVDGAATRDDARACQVHLSADQQAALEQAIRDHTGPVGTLGIAECDRWEQIATMLARCDKFPADSREAIAKGVKQTMDAWRQQQMTGDMVVSIQNACRSASDAMTQSMQQLGCPLSQP